jgi:bifunctional DNase/RNase
MIQVRVEGIAVLAGEDVPVMLLREITGRRRWLIVRIGAPEAKTLVEAQEQVAHVRPTTIELLLAVADRFGRTVERVEVTALRDDIFHSDLVFDGGLRVSARPSDSVAVALLVDVPVAVAEAVLDTAGQEIDVAGGESGRDEVAGSEEVAEFRTFLDEVKPEDFRDRPPD